MIKRILNFFKKKELSENEIDKDDLILELKRLPKNKIINEIIWDMKQIYGDKKVLRQSKKELKKISKKNLLKIMVMIKQRSAISTSENYILH